MKILLYSFKIFCLVLFLILFYSLQIQDLIPWTAYDFGVYQSIYLIHPYQWYDVSTHYYYSPFFYILFFGFHLLSFEFYIGIAVSLFIVGLIYCFLELDWFLWMVMSLNIAISIWFLSFHGNIDLILFPILILLWFKCRNDKILGLIFGLLTFKGIVVYVWPFFLWKVANKKQFIFYTIVGIALNYGWFIFDSAFPTWLLSFMSQISSNELVGPEYLLGVHYPWLWGIIVLFVNEYFERMKKRNNSP